MVLVARAKRSVTSHIRRVVSNIREPALRNGRGSGGCWFDKWNGHFSYLHGLLSLSLMSRRKKLTDLRRTYCPLLASIIAFWSTKSRRGRGKDASESEARQARHINAPPPPSRKPAFCRPGLPRLPPTTSGERRYNAEVMGQSQRKWGRCLRQRHREAPSEAVRNIERRGWFDLFGVLDLVLWRALTVIKNWLHLFRSGGSVEVWREVVSSHKMEALWTAVTPPISLCQPVKGGGGLTRRLLRFYYYFLLSGSFNWYCFGKAGTSLQPLSQPPT